MQAPSKRRNRLLASLPPDEYERLTTKMKRLRLPLGYPLWDVGREIEFVLFPIDSVASILMLMEDGSAVEVGTVGNEGMAGLPAFFGVESTPGRAFLQVAGEAWRLPAAALREETARGGMLAEVLRLYTQTFFVQVAQSTACNRLHPAEERLARWLLMTSDRVGRDTFGLTHEFLAEMLGVRRPTVSLVARTLQQAGLISYNRGTVLIEDRPGLVAASCECYEIVRAEYERVFPPLPSGTRHA